MSHTEFDIEFKFYIMTTVINNHIRSDARINKICAGIISKNITIDASLKITDINIGDTTTHITEKNEIYRPVIVKYHVICKDKVPRDLLKIFEHHQFPGDWNCCHGFLNKLKDVYVRNVKNAYEPDAPPMKKSERTSKEAQLTKEKNVK